MTNTKLWNRELSWHESQQIIDMFKAKYGMR